MELTKAIKDIDYLYTQDIARCNEGSYTTYEYTYITNIETYIKNEQFKAGANVNWNQRFPLLELDLKLKFDLENCQNYCIVTV